MGRWSSDLHRLYVRACFEQCVDWTRRAGSTQVSDLAGTFDEVDDISFLVPVSVGDLCLFDSRVLYTLPDGFEGGDGRGLVFVEVIVLVASPETAESKMSNRLYFTFSTEAADGETQIKQILPEDMSEAKRMAGRMAADARQVKEDGEA